MQDKAYVVGINGNMVNVQFTGAVMKNEVAYINVGDQKLKGEVIRIKDNIASLQVFEMTNGVSVGDSVEFTKQLLSVKLGPGLLTQVYDGLQNPLPKLAEKCGFFLTRGVYLDPIERKEWEFTPLVNKNDKLKPSYAFGQVKEGIFDHKIMVPFSFKEQNYVVKDIVKKGSYFTDDKLITLVGEDNKEYTCSMVFDQPIKRPIKNYVKRLRPDEPMVTDVRIIDTFLPIAKGGTYCVPGPFGAGKTVLQHLTSRNAKVDIVIIAACGERAGEVVEVLKEFPELIDPKTNRPLIERTIIICNTSSMPVAAREASVYTAVTLAEYYRQMGLDVLLLADSTSRWAQAMREMSGRLEEIPGEEAFPAYLESTIASFYERAGKVELYDGKKGSVTIGGTVSPAGGNFEEPVTQATLKVVGAFHGLSRERSDARKYPAIHPLESWSKYQGIIEREKVDVANSILFRSNEINNMMKVVGEEGTSMEDYIIYQKGELIDYTYLQQNSFDPVDSSVPVDRQKEVFATLYDIINSTFNLNDKDSARTMFNNLRQLFLDWNSSVYQSEEYKMKKKEINDFVKGFEKR